MSRRGGVRRGRLIGPSGPAGRAVLCEAPDGGPGRAGATGWRWPVMILMIATGASAVLCLPSPPSRASLLAHEAAPLVRLVSPRFERIGDRVRVAATLANGSATSQPAPPLRLRLLDAGGRAVATVTHLPPEGFVPADGQLRVGFETRAPDESTAARLALVAGPDAIEETSR